MRAKVTSAYVNAALAKSEALDDGYDEAIFLTKRWPCFRRKRREPVHRPEQHLDHHAGHRRHLRRGDQGDDHRTGSGRVDLPVVEREIDRTELYVADEAFFVGTGAQVSPVVKSIGGLLGAEKSVPLARKSKNSTLKL